MKRYESYIASRPLAYYELGEIYSFYGKFDANHNITPATADQIKKYSPALTICELEADESTSVRTHGDASSDVRFDGVLRRYYAIVVDKVNAGKNSYIVAMFCNKNGSKTDYYINKYAVDYGNCLTDEKNWMNASTNLNLSAAKKQLQSASTNTKVGGITRSETSQKVGGITRATTDVKSESGGVGGITAASKKKVGGITRA